MPASLSVVMRRFSFVRETGVNAGYWVNFFQRFCQGVVGDSWCADIESVCENIAYGKNITPRSGSCQVKLDYCKAHQLVVDEPQMDDICFHVNEVGHAHHIAIVTNPYPDLMTIAGNTSEDGKSSNGTGVFEHKNTMPRKNLVFARLPK